MPRMLDLAERLRNTSGKKQYGYLKAPLKAIVDEIVDELERDPRVAAAYELWYRTREEVLRTYKDDLPERLPLSRQKEFKRIKNMVIEEAVRLGQEVAVLSPEDAEEPSQYFLNHMNDFQGPPLLTNATRLLHHMSRIFRDEAPPSLPGINFVDSKLRRRIREKKIAMGHKPDDHEDQGISMR